MIIYCNPAVRDKLLERVEHTKHLEGFRPVLRPIGGIEIVTNSGLPCERPTGRIEFPDDRFIEYEPSDAEWAVPLGLAKVEMETVAYILHEPKDSFFGIGPSLVPMHTAWLDPGLLDNRNSIDCDRA